MICIESRYFHLNRILLTAIGLWPYHQSNLVRLQAILCFGILTSCVIVLLATLLTPEYNLSRVIKVLSVTIFGTIYVIHYNLFWINPDNVKCFMERLQEICNELNNENEINIMKEYGNNAKRYTFVIILFTTWCSIIIILLPIMSLIVDIVLDKNESNSHQMLHYASEFITFQEKYAYVVLLYEIVVICIGATTVVAIGTMLRGYLILACGMFKIASYRIEQAMSIKILENVSTGNEIMIYKEIICAVDIQRKAIKYTEFLLSRFEGTFMLLIAANVLSLSLNLFTIFQAMSVGNKEQILFHFMIVLVILLYMFLANNIGQEIMDHNNHVYITVYNVRWYVAPVYIQKLILFILRRRSKTFGLNIHNIFMPSLKSFAMLLKASMSYFTFMYSLQ